MLVTDTSVKASGSMFPFKIDMKGITFWDRVTSSSFHCRVYNSDNGSLADLHYHLGSQISLLCEVTAGPRHDTRLQWIFQVRGGVYGHQVTSDAGWPQAPGPEPGAQWGHWAGRGDDIHLAPAPGPRTHGGHPGQQPHPIQGRAQGQGGFGQN